MNFEGRTPLHYLARARSESLAKQILDAARNEYGIEFNLNALDHDGKTPFSFYEKSFTLQFCYQFFSEFLNLMFQNSAI